MTVDLKPYYDAARTADDEVQRIMTDMNAAFSEGTDDGKQKALDLRPALDTAKNKAQAANELYVSMRDAAATSSNAARFVPASTKTSDGAKSAAEMKRSDFEALDASARMAHIKAGGTVQEDEE